MEPTQERRRLDAVAARFNVRFASSHASLDAHLNTLGTEAKVLEFLPMAAKAGNVSLPEEIAASNDDGIVVAIVVDGNRIELSIEPLGYLSADEVAGRYANITAKNGFFNYDFRFDAHGHGRVVLANTDEVHAALLSGWQIQVGR